MVSPTDTARLARRSIRRALDQDVHDSQYPSWRGRVHGDQMALIPNLTDKLGAGILRVGEYRNGLQADCRPVIVGVTV